MASKVSSAYDTIAIDLTGPSDALEGKILLTIIDLYSRYPEVYILKHATSSEIIGYLSQSFSRFGLPRKLVSDNGTQFISNEFKHFLQSLNISHVRSSNYFPSSNGCIERFHGTLKSRLKRLLYDTAIDFQSALDKVLFDVRKTPNAMTGQTPFSLFFGRDMRNELSALASDSLLPSPEVQPRTAENEYVRNKRRFIEYHPGQLIFYRLGNHQTFSHTGSIVKKINDKSYLVLTDRGYTRVFNQSNLKTRYSNLDDKYNDSAIDYDLASYDYATPKQHQISPTQPRRYNLRSNRPHISVYKD